MRIYFLISFVDKKRHNKPEMNVKPKGINAMPGITMTQNNKYPDSTNISQLVI